MASRKTAKRATAKGKQVDALFVRTRRLTSRRRAGHTFGQQPYGIALDALTDEQRQAIESDPELAVELCTVSDDSDAAAQD